MLQPLIREGARGHVSVRQRQRERERDIQRETQRETDTDTETKRERDRNRERERERLVTKYTITNSSPQVLSLIEVCVDRLE